MPRNGIVEPFFRMGSVSTLPSCESLMKQPPFRLPSVRRPSAKDEKAPVNLKRASRISQALGGMFKRFPGRRDQTTVQRTGGRMTQNRAPATENPGVNMKDQLYLLSLLVFFVGIVSTETYYAAFNVKYQTMSLPIYHIMYRGLTAIFGNWLILGVYVVAALWLAIQNVVVASAARRHNAFAAILPYLFVAFVIAANYPLARHAGSTGARMDMYEATCTMPKVISITKKGSETPEKYYSGARLLGTDGAYVVLFWVLKPEDTESVPNIFRLGKEEANVIETSVK